MGFTSRKSMWQLVFSNILKRPTRTFVSISAVALGVVLLLVSVGLSYGQLTDQAERARRIGGDLMLQPSEASLFLAVNGGTLPIEIQDSLRSIEGVQATTPILVKFISDGFFSLFGIDRESFHQVNDGLGFVEGRMFEQPSEVVVDTIYSSVNDLSVGDSLEILGYDFSISGIYQEGTAARVMIPLETLQDLNGTPDKAGVIFIRVAEGASIEAVEARIQEQLEGYKITKTAELQSLLTNTAPAFKEFLTATSLISITISFVITLLAMYTNIIERTREVGILKSLGASRMYVLQLVLRESVVVCGLGVVVGFVMTSLVLKGLLMAFPTLPVNIMPVWRLVAAAMAIGGGSLGALYPAIKAARLDPVTALGYR